MKRILATLIASLVLSASIGGAQAAETQPSTCQGPASQCNVFFGQ
ncbi:hypothetical protein AWB78_02800 [Caballeronia calidae]|uniref:Lipoprotein n=1 Tax=Caballeronia calidae TaxID=1777139 RepID=A0A158BKX5_9BURK|nr:hypothetical protein [Caballeronia calidae]SAK70681.1 hypothetical protein AWB78_02800 [Caballeronia calidae]